ncbi:MAG: glycosyltransferase family 2 protein [Bacteriovoracaceae bacterium]|jgi:polyisoprenyl-phosphate glycosyltransferase|nr:glycosyltransferase family 2 protein [Bacteriovoracaceae bacterium]
MSAKYSVVVPCYNEEANIPLILKRFKEVINRDDIEVVLVNNGSTDDSQNVFAELLPNFSFAKVVVVVKNQGYGFGILAGLKECQGDFIGWTHADMQTDPADLIRAIDIIEESGCNEKIYVKGNRKGRAIFDQFFTTGMSIFETIYLQTKLSDINAQPNLFHKSFFKSWQSPPHDFSLDLFVLYTASKMGLETKRFDVVFPERVHGESKWNTGFGSKWKFIKRTIEFSTKLKKEITR